ncbi:phenylphosphate carboxylase subunit delta [Hydrogenovibrio sp. SC-1]|uniref:KdsC family phosphatase n=1 Tax=Hydrogenovibrio sp. SC-1 TaxID=2065820 RepID=UPI000C7E074D|nr:HAD hydrolase family protein [Hydrogenovibrio sp. SC-1]PLA73715.1 phenylphosphate carboxylase subunit delta [Hydrogenovibrio sp. SC-1]
MSFEAEITEKAQQIQLLILDVDGVLTDNKLIYGDDGQEYKAFYTRDGHGMVMLQKSGIEIGIITGRTSPLTQKRMQDLKVKHLYQGVPDKLPTFLALAEELGLEMKHIAYIGDDILDLPILTRVGLSACPKDADSEVIPRVDYVSRFNGGQGCVRELCELILKSQDRWQSHMDFYLR